MNDISKCAFACNHANESPVQCDCPDDCYCKVQGSCGGHIRAKRAALRQQALSKLTKEEIVALGLEVE